MQEPVQVQEMNQEMEDLAIVDQGMENQEMVLQKQEATQVEEEKYEPLKESQFEKLQVIGRGGFGRVQKVRSNRGRTNGKQFAMKVMAKNRCKEIKSV